MRGEKQRHEYAVGFIKEQAMACSHVTLCLLLLLLIFPMATLLPLQPSHLPLLLLLLLLPLQAAQLTSL